MNQLKKSELLALGLMMFSIFFGAGNLIFPPALGQAAGDHLGIAMAGFLATGVGLPLLGVIPEDENVPAVLGRGLSQRLKYHSGALCACENIARRLCGERVRLMRL